MSLVDTLKKRDELPSIESASCFENDLQLVNTMMKEQQNIDSLLAINYSVLDYGPTHPTPVFLNDIEKAAIELGELESISQEGLAVLMLSALMSDENDIRVAALQAISSHDSNIGEIVALVATYHCDYECRISGIKALFDESSEAGISRATQILFQYDEDSSLREEILDSFAAWNLDSAKDLALHFVNDSQKEVSEAARFIVDKSVDDSLQLTLDKGAPSIQLENQVALAATLLFEKNHALQSQVAKELVTNYPEISKGILAAGTASPDAELRLLSLENLSELDPNLASKISLILVKDKNFEVAAAASDRIKC